MFTLLLAAAVLFLAYSNGANDNFKGVASLYGSRTCGYWAALSWATAATLSGSITAVFVAETLLKTFSGKGLVPDVFTGSPPFLFAVAVGAGATVILATLTGFPISTTHGLTGALLGAGFAAAGSQVNLAMLGKAFVLPLLLSPLLALAVGGAIYLGLRELRRRVEGGKQICVCVGNEMQEVTLPQPDGVLAAQALPKLSVRVDDMELCAQRYAGRFLGLDAARLVDAVHFLSAGAVSFARGLNDTPKIAALLLVLPVLNIRWGMFAVAVVMAMGGLLQARKVADTMAHKITAMNAGQAFSANLATALLVTTASVHGLPVSTTHVSVGSLLGIGAVTRQAKWRTAAGIVLSWVITLPCAAIVAGIVFWLARP